MFTSEAGHPISDFNLMCEDERARRVRELLTETGHLLTVNRLWALLYRFTVHRGIVVRCANAAAKHFLGSLQERKCTAAAAVF